MIDQRTEELMWQHIDGRISDTDKAQLEQLVKGDPSLRTHYEELVRMSGTLSGVRSVDPPAELRNRIDAAIDASAQGVTATSSFEQAAVPKLSLWQRIFPTRSFGYAAVAAAGFLLGMIGFQLADGPARNDVPNSFYGTLVFDQLQGGGSAIQVRENDVVGSIDFRLSDGVIVAQIEIDSNTPVDVTLAYDEEFIHFDGIRDGSGLDRLRVGDGAIHLIAQRPGRHYVMLEPEGNGAGEVQVTVSRDGEIIVQKAVELADM